LHKKHKSEFIYKVQYGILILRLDSFGDSKIHQSGSCYLVTMATVMQCYYEWRSVTFESTVEN